MIFEDKKISVDEKKIYKINDWSSQSFSFLKNIKRCLKKYISFKISDEEKYNIAQWIINETFWSKLYRLKLFLSSIIATLWLLTNSIPVIIWWMLIAPILTPIKAFSFSIATWNKHIYWKSIKMLLLSIFFSILSAYFVTLLIPFAHITSEINIRTNSTFVDLLIALASWSIAMLSVRYKKRSESLAWVAMAVSLMPPLAVIWIWLQLMDVHVITWSSYLFFTNLIAILVVGIVVFYLFDFFPKNNKHNQKKSLWIAVIVFLTIIFLLLSLLKWMQSMTENYKINYKITNTVDDFFKNKDSKINVWNIDFKELDNDVLNVSISLSTPNYIKITDNDKNELTKYLAVILQKSVQLELNIVELSSVFISKKKLSVDEKLKKNISDYLIKNNITIIDFKIVKNIHPLCLIIVFSDRDIDKNKIKIDLSDIVKKYLWEDSVLLLQFKNQYYDKVVDKKIEDEKIIHKRNDVMKIYNLIFKKSSVLNFVLKEENISDTWFLYFYTWFVCSSWNKYVWVFNDMNISFWNFSWIDLCSWWVIKNVFAYRRNINLDFDIETTLDKKTIEKKIDLFYKVLVFAFKKNINLDFDVSYIDRFHY